MNSTENFSRGRKIVLELSQRDFDTISLALFEMARSDEKHACVVGDSLERAFYDVYSRYFKPKSLSDMDFDKFVRIWGKKFISPSNI